MSRKRDYTKFSKADPVIIDESAVPEPADKTPGEMLAESVVEKMLESVEPTKKGVVVDCLRLNVREAPKANAEVVCVIDASTNFVIDESESTDDFYAICTESGAEGYCMKKFIKIIP